MAKRKKNVLKDLLHCEGVAAAMILKADGTVVETLALDEIDNDAFGGLVAMAVGGAESLGAEFNLGDVQTFLMEYAEGMIAVARVRDHHVAVLAEKNALIGAVRYELLELLPQVEKAIKG